MDGLDLPTPFDTARFVDMRARTRGRPIELVPVSARPHLPCGLLVTTDRTDRILCPADTTPLHQQHIQLHEVAHLLCGHHETSPAASSAAQVLLPTSRRHWSSGSWAVPSTPSRRRRRPSSWPRSS
ncbi:hypothetical protein ACFZDK_22000 [Streptomyces sp. NPDC007901]|uniref:hypothetical protein n=1 Tax=Streptomyces sp. NPDC007901 TaxID=3364785 RepID=UPI0036EABB9A